MAKLQEFLKKFNNLVASVNFYLYLCAVTNGEKPRRLKLQLGRLKGVISN